MAKGSVRKVHFTRAVDIAFGSWLNGTKTRLQALGYKKLIDVKGGQTALNEFIRSNTPAFYVVNVPLIVRTAVESVLVDPKLISALKNSGSSSFYEDSDFIETLQVKFKNRAKLENALIDHISADLHRQLKKVSSADFYSTVEGSHKFLVKEAERLNKNKSSYIGYKIAATKAGQQLRAGLNSIGTAIVEDPETLVANMPPRSVLVVSPTFTLGVSTTNKSIDKTIARYFSKLGITLNKIAAKDIPEARLANRHSFNIGNLVHAGHTASSVDKNIVGINTPGVIVNGLISKRFEELEQAVSRLPEHIQYSVDFNPNYSTAGILLDMQFNIAVSMTGDINSGVLSPKEKATITAEIKNAVLLDLKEAVRQNFTDEVVNSIDYPVLSASPNIVEFIESSIASSILGKKALVVKSKNKSPSKQVKVKNLPKTSSTNIKIGKIKVPNQALPAASTFNYAQLPRAYTDLQIILERSIREEVQRNMGNGTATKVLNYRTGRFANSVKIERLSQSRAGMISVFYSYMKNPYATFSDGGLQQYPKSRDPKLLISKSIRDIAAREAYNNLRAVNV